MLGDYSLELMFAIEGSGADVSGVSVTLSQAGEPVFEVNDVAPWLLVKLPDSPYQVAARSSAKTVEAAITLPQSGQAEAVPCTAAFNAHPRRFRSMTGVHGGNCGCGELSIDAQAHRSRSASWTASNGGTAAIALPRQCPSSRQPLPSSTNASNVCFRGSISQAKPTP
jgi:hypothetical protein